MCVFYVCEMCVCVRAMEFVIRGGVSICVGMHRDSYHVDAPGRNRLQLVARCAVQIIEIVTSAGRGSQLRLLLRDQNFISVALKFHCARHLDCGLLRRFASRQLRLSVAEIREIP